MDGSGDGQPQPQDMGAVEEQVDTLAEFYKAAQDMAAERPGPIPWNGAEGWQLTANVGTSQWLFATQCRQGGSRATVTMKAMIELMHLQTKADKDRQAQTRTDKDRKILKTTEKSAKTEKVT